MPIPRNMPSLEQGLYDAIKKLKDIGIEESTIKYSKPKKISFFRRCADPNSKTHNIDHIDSVAIDKECLNIDGSHPMLSAHEALLKKHMDENISLKKKIVVTAEDRSANNGRNAVL